MPLAPATLVAGCKVNLTLCITGTRPDGFHELDTLFWPLPEPCDRLHLTPGPPGSGLTLDCLDPALRGPDNTVAKAWRAYGARTGFAPDLHVRLEKHIPHGAGLGGGSSDAAALLAHLNAHAWSLGLDPGELARLAAGVGADTPFFLLNRPARGQGIGERLTPVDLDLSGLSLLLLCPPLRVATGPAYAAWDALPAERKLTPLLARGFLTECTAKGKRPPLFRACLWNSFEAAVFPAHPELRRCKEELLRRGACAAVLSGSGASLVALFRDRQAARVAGQRFGQEGVAWFVREL